MSHDFVMAVPRNHEGERDVGLALEHIEDRIEAIEDELATCAPLVKERDRLMRARALLMNAPPEPVPPGKGNRRVTRDDVADALAAAPGLRAGQLALTLGTSQQVVSAHLYRGKASRFENRGGQWFLRREADQG